MSGQHLPVLPVAEPSPHLSLEAAQSIASPNDRSGRRQLVLGLSGLMLMGVAVCGALSHGSHVDSISSPTHHGQGSFTFGPAVKPGGFRTATHEGGMSSTTFRQTVDPLSPSREARVRQAMVRMSDPEAMKWARTRVNPEVDPDATRDGDGTATDDATILSTMPSVAVAAMDPSMGPAQRASEVNRQVENLPVQERKKMEMLKTDVRRKAKEMPGITAPLGFFDPLGFTTDCPEGKLYFYREVEVKHGRVAMLASLGFIVGEQFHPLFGGDVDVPSYIAFQNTPLQTFWPAVVAAIAVPEIFSILTFKQPWETETWPNGEKRLATWSLKTDREPGDFGFDPLGLRPKLYEDAKKMQTKELNNGRLAMIAAAGMVAQELVTGQKLFVDVSDPFTGM